MPLSLSDAELEAVLAAAQPLAPKDRDFFLRHVADALERYPEIGPGVIHRVMVEKRPRLLRCLRSSRPSGGLQGISHCFDDCVERAAQ